MPIPCRSFAFFAGNRHERTICASAFTIRRANEIVTRSQALGLSRRRRELTGAGLSSPARSRQKQSATITHRCAPRFAYGQKSQNAAEIVLLLESSSGYHPPERTFHPPLFFSRRKARMFSGVDFGQLCVMSTVQACGILCAALSRVFEGQRWQALFQQMFLGLLVVVAFMAVLNVWNSPQHWMMTATTLAVMVVTATCDFSRPL
jgi:hypothetical protein